MLNSQAHRVSAVKVRALFRKEQDLGVVMGIFGKILIKFDTLSSFDEFYLPTEKASPLPAHLLNPKAISLSTFSGIVLSTSIAWELTLH